jgi:integrase
MPRRAKGARLYPRSRKGRGVVWVIRDGEYEESTGCGEAGRAGAERKLQEYLAKKFIPNHERHPSELTISEVLMMYAKTRAPNHAAPKLVSYHLGPLLDFWGEKLISDIKGQSCRNYVEWRLSQKRKESTARRELITLRAAVNAWHEESPLPALPVVVVPPEGEARQRYLTRREAARLLRAARRLGADHVARFILVGLYTGTRHAALLSLSWLPSISGGHVDIAQSVIHRRGFGQRETNKRRPPARIPERLMSHLRRWQRSDMVNGISHVITWQGQPIQKERRAWARVVNMAGLSAEVTPHVLRHTCATWALQEGVEQWHVAALLGTSVAQIERTYGHHDPKFQEAISGAFSGARKRG